MYKRQKLNRPLVILRRVNRDRLKDLVSNAGENIKGTTFMATDREVGIVVDNGDAGDLTRTKGRKCRMSDKEATDTRTSKKSKVRFRMRMLVLVLLTVHIL